MNIGRLRICFLLVDVGFVAYWVCVWLHLFPDSYLFKDYEDPILQAWNFSFLPLDLLVSASGLGSLWLQARGRAGWEVLALVSLILTMCSGLQAIAFWAIRGDYDMVWWAPNLFLFIYPFFLRRAGHRSSVRRHLLKPLPALVARAPEPVPSHSMGAEDASAGDVGGEDAAVGEEMRDGGGDAQRDGRVREVPHEHRLRIRLWRRVRERRALQQRQPAAVRRRRQRKRFAQRTVAGQLGTRRPTVKGPGRSATSGPSPPAS